MAGQARAGYPWGFIRRRGRERKASTAGMSPLAMIAAPMPPKVTGTPKTSSTAKPFQVREKNAYKQKENAQGADRQKKASLELLVALRRGGIDRGERAQRATA